MPDIEQSSETLMGIRIVMIGIPIIFVIISYFIYKYKFKLTDEYYEKIMNILALRKQELATSVDNKEVIESKGKESEGGTEYVHFIS